MAHSGTDRTTATTATALAVLRQRFGDRLQTGQALREQHAGTLTWVKGGTPDAVILAETTAEVQDVVRICAAHRLPLIAFGGGTSLEGHVSAPKGGLSLDLSKMNRILKVNAEDLDCEVEAGVTRGELGRFLRDTGLFFPVDPGAEEATLGGMAATRASGTTTMRYGSMRDNVLSVTAVMADGAIVKTARRARKSASGYDLTRLLVGSEGTLGIITELNLRLYGVPETILAAVCPFETVAGACNAVIQAIQMGGLGLARIEFLDPKTVEATNAYSKLSLAIAPTLFLEFHGSPAGTKEYVAQFEEIARGEGAIRFDWAEGAEERNRLLKARHDAFWAQKTKWAGREPVVGDVCVPISRLAECLTEAYEDFTRLGVEGSILGHVGDGNFHAVPFVDKSNPAEVKAVETYLERMVERALAAGGTCTGEHGVGYGKLKYLAEEHGAGLAVMRSLKQALDPLGILNPGKMGSV